MTADPTWFDWISNVAIPALMGLASLVVAIAALSISKGSNRLAKEIHESNATVAARDERRHLARLIFEWSARRWLGDPPTSIEDKAALSTARSIFSVELTQSAEPGTSALQSVLWDIDHRVPEDLSATGYAYFAGSMHASVERIVAQWLNLPTDTEKLRDMAERALEAASKGAQAKRGSKSSLREAAS